MKFKEGDHVRSTMNQWRAIVARDSTGKIVFELKCDAAGNKPPNGIPKRIEYDEGMESSLELDSDQS